MVTTAASFRTEMRASAPAWEPRSTAPPSAPPGLAPPGVHTSIANTNVKDVEAPPGLSNESCDEARCSDYGWFVESLSPYEVGLRDGLLAAQFAALLHEASLAAPLRRNKVRRSFSDVSSDTASTIDSSHEEAVDFEVLAINLHSTNNCKQHALDSICETAQSLCKTQEGSRLVQAALGLAQGSRLDALVNQLKGTVLETSKSPHGNHVMTTCIDVVGPDRVQFMVDEMKGKAVVIARDRFGCRVIQQLVESCPQEQVSTLIDELMTDGPRLMGHPFANFVMQSALRLGTPERRAQIINILLKDLRGYSRHRIARNIVKLASECGLSERLVENSESAV